MVEIKVERISVECRMNFIGFIRTHPALQMQVLRVQVLRVRYELNSSNRALTPSGSKPAVARDGAVYGVQWRYVGYVADSSGRGLAAFSRYTRHCTRAGPCLRLRRRDEASRAVQVRCP